MLPRIGKFRILGIDPGGTTGFAIVQGPLLNPGKLKYVPESFKQIKGRKGALSYLESVIEEIDIVVCEDFSPYQGKRLQFDKAMIDTVKLIGNIETTCKFYSKQFVVQPALHKNIGFKVSKIELTSASDPQRHQKDALAHACYYIHTHKD